MNLTACREEGGAPGSSADSAGEVKEANLMEVEYDCVGENFVPGEIHIRETTLEFLCIVHGFQ